MRRFFSRWDNLLAHKFQAIAAIGVLSLSGIALRHAAISNAGTLNPPPDIPPKQQATATARVLHREQQVRQIRPENYDLSHFPVQESFEKHWKHMLWTTAVIEPQDPFVAEGIDRILAMSVQPGLSNAQKRTVDMAMKVATQLYLTHTPLYQKIGQRFLDTVERSPDPEWVAVALSGLAKSGLAVEEQHRLSEQIQNRFPHWQTNVFLQTTLQETADIAATQALPPLADLLKWNVAPQQLHLYVLCRPDRRILCRAVLKNRKGELLRVGDRLWSTPLLLESIHGLGWNFTRGQTPQGIFRIEGTVSQTDDEFFRAYGQFELVNLFVPFEAGAKQFLPGKPGAFTGNLSTYQALLPPTWRNYRPIQQSYWAGRIGRGLFRIHGTGESPNFFNGKDKNYPDSFEWNPTIGCLSARELYSEGGKLLQADMPKILGALRQVGGKNFTGYLVVVDVPGQAKEPVALKEIETALSAFTRGNQAGNLARQRKNTQSPTAPSSALALRSPKSAPSSLQPQVNRTKLAAQTILPRSQAKASNPQVKSTSEPLEPLPVAY